MSANNNEQPLSRKFDSQDDLTPFEDFPVGIFRTTPDGKVLYANPALAHILGYKDVPELLAGIQGSSKNLYVSLEDREMVLNSAQSETPASLGEVAFRHASGDAILCTLNVRLMTDEQGNTVYFQGACHDITALKAMEKKLADINAELEERVRQRTLDLEKVNLELSKEIEERKRVEVELQQLVDAEKRRRVELEKLAKVSQSLRKAKKSAHFIEMLTKELLSLCHAEMVAGVLFRESDSPVVTSVKGTGQLLTEDNKKVILRSLESAKTSRPVAEAPGFESRMLLKLESAEKTHGAVLLASRDAASFSAEQQNMLAAISDMAGTALQRIEVMENLEWRGEERRQGLVVLYNLMTIISENLRLDDILELSLILTLETIGVKKGILYTLDTSSGSPALQIAVQRWDSFPAPILKDVLAEKVLAAGKEMVETDLHGQPGYENIACGYAGIPIRSHGKLRGVLSLFSDDKQKFSAEVMALLRSISDHIGLGIENAQNSG